MNIKTLIFVSNYRRINHSQLARDAGVTRQRVSQWFKDSESCEEISIRSANLLRLSNALGISADTLLNPIPLWEEVMAEEQTNLLWDHLYPNFESFIRAIILGQSNAISRLVEVKGLFVSAQIAGKRVWKSFHKYKNNLPPKRREELEIVWQIQMDLGLI